MFTMHVADKPSRRLVLAGLAGSLLASSRLANAQTIAALKASSTLRAGVQISQAPWGFMDNAGRNEGFEIDLLRAFEGGTARSHYPQVRGRREHAAGSDLGPSGHHRRRGDPGRKPGQGGGTRQIRTEIRPEPPVQRLRGAQGANRAGRCAEISELPASGDEALPIIKAPY